MKAILKSFAIAGTVLALLSLSLAQNTGAPAAGSAPSIDVGSDETNQTPMLTPPPVSGVGYSMAFTSERRSNYLRGGVTVQASHDDDLFTTTGGHAVGDWSYSIWPTISLDQTWQRFRWDATYVPGFTFYQNVPGYQLSSYNQQDQNLSLSAQYRLSRHVTLSVHDYFQKTSNLLNQPLIESSTIVTGASQSPNYSVVAPVSNVLRNSAGVELTYQYSPNDMVGAEGATNNLHFLDDSTNLGLYDAAGRGGSGFYSHRINRHHYLGVSYLFQQLFAYPIAFTNTTTTNSALAFYTYYPRRSVSLSFFGGPQHASTDQFGAAPYSIWTTAAGVSAGYQAAMTSGAISLTRGVSDGGGLVGAVESLTAAISLRQQLSKAWSTGAQASYADNTLLQAISPAEQQALPSYSGTGHSLSGSLWLQRSFGEHFTAQAGYLHVHQSYNGLVALDATTNRNREWVSLNYQFVRPLGR